MLSVGIFDSGIGGLTVLRACARLLPGVRFYYFGDNRHAPYGNRPPGEIFRFVRSALGRFGRLGVDAAVLACNTATAVCAERLRGEFPFPVVGTEPAVRLAAARCKNALVLCTPRTAASGRLRALIGESEGCRFTVCPCPGLAAAVERSDPGDIDLSLHLPQGEFDGVVLGCTHYSFLRREISAFYGAPVFDGNEGVARRLAAVLGEEGRRKAGFSDHFRKELNKTSSAAFDREKMTESNIIFIGSNKNRNKKRYEQTFIFDFST